MALPVAATRGDQELCVTTVVLSDANLLINKVGLAADAALGEEAGYR